jgi:hypothetical protein
MTKEHVCTRKCLRWSVAFGRRFYYCALTVPVVVRPRGELKVKVRARR